MQPSALSVDDSYDSHPAMLPLVRLIERAQQLLRPSGVCRKLCAAPHCNPELL